MFDELQKQIRSERVTYRSGQDSSFNSGEVSQDTGLFGPGELVLSPGEMREFIREMESISYDREMIDRFPRAKAKALEIVNKRMGNGYCPDS